jgi:hypothetical protein
VPATTVPATTVPATTVPAVPPVTRPAWLGRRSLATDDRGHGIPEATPPELVDRRLPTVDLLPPPSGEGFEATVGPVPPEVAARSTWRPGCPVDLDALRYLTVSHWGFDDRFHTGELLVAAEWAEPLVGVFEELHRLRFPIEEMRVTRVDELAAPPTGDGNTTGGFVCRPVVGGTTFSEHAYGRAVDVNPFHNPYRRGERILPELAGAYLDRGHVRPGMILADGPVVAAFAAIGWSWGGDWSSLTDLHHFSATGR